jgi:hypothetical protein
LLRGNGKMLSVVERDGIVYAFGITAGGEILPKPRARISAYGAGSRGAPVLVTLLPNGAVLVEGLSAHVSLVYPALEDVDA